MEETDYKRMTVRGLERLWQSKRDELVKIKMEIDKRKGDVPPPKTVDFEQYITK